MDKNTMLEEAKVNILIVDDEIITVKGILNGVNWEQLGFDNVWTCTDADDAKDIFKKNTVDILVSDIEMPECSGIELLTWVREKGYDSECIFLTCHDKFTFAQKAVQLRCFNYLLKPTPYDQLTNLLMEIKKHVLTKKKLEKYQEWGKSTIHGMEKETFMNEDRKKEIVDRVKIFIREHISEDLTAEKLAEQVYLSADYMCRIFKKQEKMTVVEYITNERLFCAAELLEKTKMTVAQVAISVGYNNYSYFTKRFKQKYNVTPNEYGRHYHKEHL